MGFRVTLHDALEPSLHQAGATKLYILFELVVSIRDDHSPVCTIDSTSNRTGTRYQIVPYGDPQLKGGELSLWSSNAMYPRGRALRRMSDKSKAWVLCGYSLPFSIKYLRNREDDALSRLLIMKATGNIGHTTILDLTALLPGRCHHCPKSYYVKI
ncbi:hypothetical protein J1614_004654 [Plenodomus biglobosus]|nr:hypothetical protein J1614_004654 [Plenodomus biglobosus]